MQRPVTHNTLLRSIRLPQYPQADAGTSVFMLWTLLCRSVTVICVPFPCIIKPKINIEIKKYGYDLHRLSHPRPALTRRELDRRNSSSL